MQPLLDEDRLWTYNFFPRRPQERLAAALSVGAPSRVLVLVGDLADTAYCLEAAVFGLADNPNFVALDTSGWERGTSVAAYLQHQIQKRRIDRVMIARLLEAIEVKLKADIGLPGILGISIALKKGLPLADLLLGEGDTISDDNRDPREVLSRVLREATSRSRLIVHVSDVSGLNVKERWWLINEAKRNDRFVLAFSSNRSTDNPLIPEVASAWIEIQQPLRRTQLASVINECCQQNDFDSTLLGALWQYSRGHSRLVSSIVVDLIRNRCIRREKAGWRTVGSEAEIAKVFEATLYKPIEDLASALLLVTYQNLERFLQLASLCGELIPATYLFGFMELDHDAVANLTNAIDASLVKIPEPFLFDLQFDCEGFRPDCRVYAFTNLLVVHEVHSRIPERVQALASNLLQFLENRVRFNSKAKAKMALTVAGYSGDTEKEKRMHDLLDWWFLEDYAKEAEDDLVRMMSSGEIHPETVWAMVKSTAGQWPARRRLALLHVYEQLPDGVPDDRLMEFLALKVSLFTANGHFQKAEPAARHLLQLRRGVLGPEHPNTLTSMHNLGTVLDHQGRNREAQPIFREALDLHRRVLGPEHPNTLSAMNNFGSVLTNQGRYGEAEPIFREALDLRRSVLGPEHPDTLKSMNNFGSVLNNQGRYGEAEPLNREALDLHRRVLGPEHPDTLTSMNNFGSVLDSQGRYGEAEPILREALDLRRRVLGPEHPDTLTSMNNLAGTMNRLRQEAEGEDIT